MRFLIPAALLLTGSALTAAETVALWLFDEPVGLYPSTPLEASAGIDAPLVLGLGGSVVPGRFGQALSTTPFPSVTIPSEGELTAALHRFPVPPGRTMEPLSWHNAQFTALMTSGERQIRREVTFARVTHTDLNLGAFDWTVEFWLRSQPGSALGVVLELGTGPRGENDVVTRLSLDRDASRFIWENPGSGRINLISLAAAINDTQGWHHYTFVHDAARGRLIHFVDGHPIGETSAIGFHELPKGDEDYLTLGRDGHWTRPLAGALDEFRISRGAAYTGAFTPKSFAPAWPKPMFTPGPPLLFAPQSPRQAVVELGSRRHLFLDDSIMERRENIAFTAHPPQRIEPVFAAGPGPFRKHLTVVEDEKGLIRIYNGGPDDYLMVHTATDGVHFTAPDTGMHHKGRRNIVIAEPAALGRPILDPQAPPAERWKYVSGLEGRGVYLYTSADGWKWTRQRTAVLSFRSGSQSGLFYDDQRGCYVGYHRTGFPRSAGGGTRREFVMSETRDIHRPWPVPLLSAEEVHAIAANRRLRNPKPWWLDNGPLTPGDFGIELPTVFQPDERMDPPGSGVYVPKADKYPWAPDAYFAFPVMYFDYEEPAQPATRRVLYEDKSRGLGSGMVETQAAVSRDGIHWTRFPSPTYLQVGEYAGRNLHQIYIAEGMVRRGDEIWQYFFGNEEYHSPARRLPDGGMVYRAVQRLDGFVSADAPYDRTGLIITRPFTFTGQRLELNINTGAMGFAQVGFEDQEGRPISGFGVDDCVFINGNFVHHTVEWLGQGKDVSSLAGRTVRLVVRLRGASLYALQFLPR